MDIHVVTVTSKGQITIPKEICEELSIKKGDSLVANTVNDTIIFSPVKLPTQEDFQKYYDEAEKGGVLEEISKFVKEERRKMREQQ